MIASPTRARLACALIAVSVVGAAATPTAGAAPSYLRTIGHPAHAEMYPSGVDVNAGIVYVADTGNDQIAAYSADDRQLWRVGTRGPKALGRFENPRDIAYLGGRLYVADNGYNRVQVLDARNGHALAAWPTRFQSIIGVSAGVTAAGDGVVLVSDERANRVTIHRPDGDIVRTLAPRAGSANGQFNAPRDAATAADGTIYVADYLNNRIAVFRPDGSWVANFGRNGPAPGEFGRPYGVDVGPDGTVYVADSTWRDIDAFTRTGTFLRRYGSKGTGPGQFEHLRRVAVSGTSVYGADLWGNAVTRFAVGGALERTYGGPPAASGGFNEAAGVAVDTATFVVDAVNQRIERFDTDSGGMQLTWGVRGSDATDAGDLNWPRDITIDATAGTVWVADTKNSRISEFTRGGAATGRSFGGLGSGPSNLHWPFGLVAVPRGIVVADTLNNRVQLRDRTGRPLWTTARVDTPRDVAARGSEVFVAAGGAIVVLDLDDGGRDRSFGALQVTAGVAIDDGGGVWAADTGRDRIVHFGPGGAVVEAFGGFGAAHGLFNKPTHLEVAGTRLFVADQWNDRIEVFGIG